MDVPFLQLFFTVAQTRKATAPYALFEVKQLFPAVFRSAVGCALPGRACTAGADCPCRSTFDQELTVDPAALRRYQKPPLPFAFKFPLVSCVANDEYELSLVIVGDATRYLELYCKSLQQLFGSNQIGGGVRLLNIAAIAADGTRQTLGAGSGKLDLAAVPFRTFAEAGSLPVTTRDSITLQLRSPLRLLKNGKPQCCPLFPALAGALFRRVSALAYYYGGIELDHDFKWLAAQSRSVSSTTQLEWANWGGALQGAVGEFTFSGELEEFMPFLRLGELLNVGKGASYGMGSYQLTGS